MAVHADSQHGHVPDSPGEGISCARPTDTA
jgi:hypothetical protein